VHLNLALARVCALGLQAGERGCVCVCVCVCALGLQAGERMWVGVWGCLGVRVCVERRAHHFCVGGLEIESGHVCDEE
jgi:hypothetical protein